MDREGPSVPLNAKPLLTYLLTSPTSISTDAKYALPYLTVCKPPTGRDAANESLSAVHGKVSYDPDPRSIDMLPSRQNDERLRREDKRMETWRELRGIDIAWDEINSCMRARITLLERDVTRGRTVTLNYDLKNGRFLGANTSRQDGGSRDDKALHDYEAVALDQLNELLEHLTDVLG